MGAPGAQGDDQRAGMRVTGGKGNSKVRINAYGKRKSWGVTVNRVFKEKGSTWHKKNNDKEKTPTREIENIVSLCEHRITLQFLEFRSRELNVDLQRGGLYGAIPIVGSCTISSTYVFFVIPSSTAVNSGSSISRAWNSSRMRVHECFSALISSLVRS